MPLYLTKSQAAKYIGIPICDFEELVSLGAMPDPEEGLSEDRWDKSDLRCHWKQLDIGRGLGGRK
jgi:hypothetical protein